MVNFFNNSISVILDKTYTGNIYQESREIIFSYENQSDNKLKKFLSLLIDNR